MSLPKILNRSERLEIVKNKFAEDQNIEIIEQVPYSPKPSGLPNLKALSFILYKDLSDNSYKVANTINTDITKLSIEEFNKFDISKLSDDSIKVYQGLIEKINQLNQKKRPKP